LWIAPGKRQINPEKDRYNPEKDRIKKKVILPSIPINTRLAEHPSRARAKKILKYI
jgi:hypothetical protein